MREWKAFELLAQKIQQDLAPEATVTIDEKVVGKKTGVSHQCDLVLRSKVGQLDYTCVFECKDHAEPVGLELMRSFVARMDDLAVSQGVVVASRGFTRDARTFAHANGVITYTLVDAQSAKWNEQALLPVLLTYIELGSATAQFTNSETGQRIAPGEIVPGVPITAVPLVDTKSGHVLTLRQYLEKKWDEVLPNRLPSEADQFSEPPRRFELVTPVGRVPVTMTCTLVPRVVYYYNWVPLMKGRGFLDQEAEAFHTGDDYEAGPLDFRNAIRTWPNTEDRDAVPLKPLDVFFMGRYYYRKDRQGPDIVTFGRERVK